MPIRLYLDTSCHKHFWRVNELTKAKGCNGLGWTENSFSFAWGTTDGGGNLTDGLTQNLATLHQ